jgi:prepilin-type N-terminal cleavage/methylation domain-containing protein
MKKGFTLIELLVVIVVIGLVAMIAYPAVGDIITSMKERSFVESRKGLIRAAKLYMEANQDLLPYNTGDITEIPIATLVSDKFIKEVKSPADGSTCGGYILIRQNEYSAYDYYPQYRCGASSSITSRETDSLVLDYTFDDFQEPTVNLATYNTTMSNLALSASYNPTAYMSVQKISANRYKATYTTDVTYSSGIVGLLAASIPIGTYTISANTLDYYREPASTATHGLGFNSNGSPAFTALGYASALYTRTSANNFGVRIGTGTINAGSYIDWENLQIEAKPYATPFTEGTRTGTVTDYSGNGLNSPLSIGSTPRWVFDNERKSGVYQFDNDTITFGTGNTFFPLNTFTMMAWIKTPGLGSGMSLNGIASITYGLTFYLDGSGNLNFRMDNGTSIPAISVARSLHDNKYHHVAVQFDGTNMKMYIDGELMRTSAFSGWTGSTRWPTNSAIIGQENNNGAIYRFNGSIDNFKIFNRALNNDEVKTLYYMEKLN